MAFFSEGSSETEEREAMRNVARLRLAEAACPMGHGVPIVFDYLRGGTSPLDKWSIDSPCGHAN